jgi:hypothetical protein
VFPFVPMGVRAALGVCALLALLLVSGCGGGKRADASEPNAGFTMKVLDASFPADQSIARPTRLQLQVQNTSARTMPNVAVTLDSFYYTEHYPELASDKRPVWVVERGPGAIAAPPVQTQSVSPPGGGQTAYVSTWALGPLAPGRTQTFVWRVVPVKAGRHTVHFTVAAGLAGKAKAELASGGPVQGQLSADIAPIPAARHVDPHTGKVVPGQFTPVP